LKWSKDGDWLQQGDRVQVLDNAVSCTSELKISRARVEDSGVYSAEASNVHGAVQTTAVVKVTKSVQETSEHHRETSVVESAATEIVEEIRERDTEEILRAKDKVVVREETEEKTETEEIEESHKEVYEVATERVEILTSSRPSHQRASLTEIDKVGETQDVVLSSVKTTGAQAFLTDTAEVKMSEVTEVQQVDVSEEVAEVIPANEEKVQSPVTDVIPQSLEIIDQETVATVSDDQMLEAIQTTVTETSAFSYDDVVIKLEDELREAVVSESLVGEDANKGKNATDQPEEIPEISRTADHVPGDETDVNFVSTYSAVF